MIIWIIGLSGSGKTTLATEVIKQCRKDKKKVILLDGDEVRDLFQNDADHSLKGRKVNADRICRLCKFLDSQNIDVVCAILSVFKESREWCRMNLSSYYEVYIETPMDILRKRDPKKIYSSYFQGEISNVAGLDLNFEVPEKADLHIINNQRIDHLLSYSKTISRKIKDD